jgi:hypothetical protein
VAQLLKRAAEDVNIGVEMAVSDDVEGHPVGLCTLNQVDP